MSNPQLTDWEMTTDIYDIVSMLDDVKKQYIEDEDETTLALGIFGFLIDTEAKKIQTAVVNTGLLGNEMFPQRAILDKNITTHAIYCNVDNLNAKPAHIVMGIGIKESDFERYAQNNRFIIDRTCSFTVEEYEFHPDYDIIVSRVKQSKNGKWYYNAYYDMTTENPIATVKDPYLKQPAQMVWNNFQYIFMIVPMQQVAINTIKDKMITASVIDNKSFSFTFSDQLAGFSVKVTDRNKTHELKPLIYGSAIEAGVTDYCWYLYMNDHTVRIGFDQNSFLPGLNASIEVTTYTTKGEEGNFSYKTDLDDAAFYVDLEEERYGYRKIQSIVSIQTDSTDGTDKKSIEELKNLIPKMAMSRGYITTETDLNNYFNLISTEDNRMKLQKKVDNQLNRIWYCYLLLKDAEKNIIPTNTLPIKIDLSSEFVKECLQEEGRYYIPAGTLFKYDQSKGYAVPVASTPDRYSDEFFPKEFIYYYRILYNIIINLDPMYCAYYMTINDMDGYFEFEYVNPNMFMGYIVSTCHFERWLLSRKDEYRLTFNTIQSIQDDMGLYVPKVDEHNAVIEGEYINNMKAFVVLCKQGEPYRYAEAELTQFDFSQYLASWQVTFKTDDDFDTLNNIKLLDLYEPGQTTKNYGFFDDHTEAYVYLYGKFDEDYGRYSADSLIPNMEGYTLMNIYKVADGLQLFNNFTAVTNTRIRENRTGDGEISNYDISGIPMIGEHYFTSEANVTYLIHELLSKKAYVDHCLDVLENNMDIDFKLFNTYGYSYTYHIGDKDKTSLGDIDIVMKFRCKLANQNDVQTKNAIIQYIKGYIEDMNNVEHDLHVPNLLHDIKEYFGDLIVYCEFMNFNDNRLGVNHIELRNEEELTPHTVPEFISVRNRWNVDKTALEPCIDVEFVLV